MSVHSLGRPLRRAGHPTRHNNIYGRVRGEAAPEAEAEEAAPEWSMSNTKAQLLAAAADLGVEADSGMTKAQILAAIEAA
tara:strand:+ start:1349 stop:1588 length:240 start_codon:yes stop_codon:yes gene_type:complete